MSKVLLIMGGASGIGAATARLAAAQGYSVAINYRTREEEALRLVEELKKCGNRAIAVQADVSLPEDIERLFKTVDLELGRITALVNSAGICNVPTRVEDTDPAFLHRLLQINVLGLIISSREAVRRMSIARGGSGGVIINLSSMASTIGGRPGVTLYAASKGAVDAFTVGLAKEVATDGIRVVAVRPGYTITEMTASTAEDPRLLAEISATIPLGRPGRVEEIAKPIIWLLSEEASFISGALVDISGGGFTLGGSCLPPKGN